MRIFCTGGSGFIGTNLISYFLIKGHTLINYDMTPPRNPNHANLWVQGDVRDETLLPQALRKFNPEYIVHLAARTDLDGGSIAEYSSNTDGVFNLVNTLCQCDSLKRVLFASSRLVCKIGYLPRSEDDYCPSTHYGESKVQGEQIVRGNSNRINSVWAIFRPTSIWGPWFDTPYKEFFFSILRSHYIHPKGLQIPKSFGYVGNSVYMLERMLTCDPLLIQGKTFYLADFPPIEVKAWADLIANKNGTPAPREIPRKILCLIALVGDYLKFIGWKKPPLTTFRLNNLMTEMVYDTSVVEQLCEQLPYSVSEGVEQTLEWIRTMRRPNGS